MALSHDLYSFLRLPLPCSSTTTQKTASSSSTFLRALQGQFTCAGDELLRPVTWIIRSHGNLTFAPDLARTFHSNKRVILKIDENVERFSCVAQAPKPKQDSVRVWFSTKCWTSNKHKGRASRGWATLRNPNLPHSFTCSFEYSNVFEISNMEKLHDHQGTSYRMTHIEAKSINIWLRYDPKCNPTSLQMVRLHFGSYLSQMWMDFASIWVIL